MKSRKTSEKKEGDSGEIGIEMFGVSLAEDYCNWADFFQVFSQGTYVTTMEKIENTKTPKMFSVKALYWNLS